ncbi:hypothetical protein ZHAS_00005316 [Anopheles sinensis]|uniref:Uncharacterized protein n=1 Tax=Anopheles sinensis TaxID=74873 RepID=A0A084VJ69_ANOSI|nr:hypothetical protein ZHAS_00005316 [Anopheles sinensis]
MADVESQKLCGKLKARITLPVVVDGVILQPSVRTPFVDSDSAIETDRPPVTQAGVVIVRIFRTSDKRSLFKRCS